MSITQGGFLLQVARGFMEKLEQVSEDPSLKEEMEKEVHSTSAQVRLGRVYSFKI